MKRRCGQPSHGWLTIIAGVLAVGLSACSLFEPTPPEIGYLSPSLIVASRDGAQLLIAEETARRVVVLDLATTNVTQTIRLPAPPSGLALSADGRQLFVTCAAPAGLVCVVDLARGKVADKIAVGHTPTAPVLSPDGKTLFVCNQFNNNVAVVDLAAGKVVATIPVAREPVAAVLTADGKRLLVANLLPTGRADADYVGAVISVIDTTARRALAAIRLPNGSASVHDLCLSPDGKFAYVTHVLAHYQLPTTQLDRGWMNTAALSILDVAGGKLVNTVLLDDVDSGAANPWGVACSADGKTLGVAHAGTHEVSVIDRAGLHAKLDAVAAGKRVSEVSQKPADVPNDLSFLVGLRERVKLAGNGPRGVVIVGNKLYVAEYFTDGLGVVALPATEHDQGTSVALGPPPAMPIARRGEMLFHDATRCFQRWQSCASCHPGGGRVDGLNWDLLNDGIGNPKNVKSLLLVHKTPPAMSLGERESAEAAVRAGFRHIQFAVVPEEEARAVDEYLETLTPVPSPYLVKGKLSAEAKRGQKLFERVGCASCHPAPLYTTLAEYNLGDGKGLDQGKAFDTPTLIECWRTAPYLHDGSIVTVQELLGTHKHGLTGPDAPALNDRDLNDLAVFVLSL